VKYKLVLKSRAKKDIQSLDVIVQKRLVKKLKFYIQQDNPLQYAKRLVDPSDASYRWRIGHYRVVFDVNGKDIVILRVQHRSEVYKK